MGKSRGGCEKEEGNIIQVTEKKISELKRYKNNPKKHGESQLRELVKSIQRYGFRTPVLIDSKNNIIAGHGRVDAARRAGLTAVPCICFDDMTPEEVRQYRIVDNRLAEIGSSWDMNALGLELAELDFGELDFEFLREADLPDFLSFDESETLRTGNVWGAAMNGIRVSIGQFTTVIKGEDTKKLWNKTAKLGEEKVREAVMSLIREIE